MRSVPSAKTMLPCQAIARLARCRISFLSVFLRLDVALHDLKSRKHNRVISNVLNDIEMMLEHVLMTF